MGHAKAALVVVGGAALTAVVAQVNATCPDLLKQWPALLMAAATTALAAYMKSPNEPKG